MKLGLWITARFGPGITFVQHFGHMREQVRLARDGGFGMISGGQHYLGPRLQTMPLLARLGEDAGEMEIATSVVLLPLHNPVDLAEQAATMNAMFDGRFILGVGLGHQADERAAFGIAKEEVAGRFDEAIEVMERVWDGDGRPFQGRHFTLPELRLPWPIPYVRPRIWIGGSSNRALLRARAHDRPWFPSDIDLDGLVARYASNPPVRGGGSTVGGRQAAPALPVGIWAHIADTDKQAWADATRLGQVDPARPNWPVSLVGSPDTVVELIEEYRRRLDPSHLLLRVELPGMTQPEVMRRIELLAEHVVPRIG